MAKELPYFRFTASEWLNDDISLESNELKGFFIDVCAYYWMQDCDVTLNKLNKRFSNATNLLEQLIKSDIIKHENKHDKIKIDFLVIQYDLLSEKRKVRQRAGSKGGNAKAKKKQKGSYKDKDKYKDKYKEFIGIFNTITGRDFKGDQKSKSQFNARLDEGFNLENLDTAIKNCFNDKYHIENRKYLTPEFITRSDKFQKFYNADTIDTCPYTDVQIRGARAQRQAGFDVPEWFDKQYLHLTD